MCTLSLYRYLFTPVTLTLPYNTFFVVFFLLKDLFHFFLQERVPGAVRDDPDHGCKLQQCNE